MTLINDIDTLRKYVKLNASTDWDTYYPFVLDAQEKYIMPFFGNSLLEALISKEGDPLKEIICRALGPFSLALATDELSINFGEMGHTVSRTPTEAPASDAKIAKATESLFERGWNNLDRALSYAIANANKYNEWSESEYTRQIGTNLFANFNEFQNEGLIDINYSPLTFMRLRMLILRIEKSETLLLIPSSFEYEANAKLFTAMQAYTASRVAELQTNAAQDKSLKDAPPIQLLRESNEANNNYYAAQSNHWKAAIINILIEENAVEDSSYLKWNDQDKKVFVANARRL